MTLFHVKSSLEVLWASVGFVVLHSNRELRVVNYAIADKLFGELPG
jgi:hypothetical protein